MKGDPADRQTQLVIIVCIVHDRHGLVGECLDREPFVILMIPYEPGQDSFDLFLIGPGADRLGVVDQDQGLGSQPLSIDQPSRLRDLCLLGADIDLGRLDPSLDSTHKPCDAGILGKCVNLRNGRLFRVGIGCIGMGGQKIFQYGFPVQCSRFVFSRQPGLTALTVSLTSIPGLCPGFGRHDH